MAPSSVPAFIGAVPDSYELFSDRTEDFSLGPPIGFGASSIVYAAEYRPQSDPHKRIPCALKVLDLDKLPPHSLALLQRETTLMSLSKHPNVLRVRGSWLDNHKLFIALRLMNRGSAADIMKYGWPGGLEEDVIRCILEQALQGLNYLHVNGFIHRDVKAANLLVDDDGTVLLGDLGVAADLAEDISKGSSSLKRPVIVTAEAAVRPVHGGSSSHDAKPSSAEGRKVGKRKSFVGTPCWMAPEVIEARHYDSSADIWSFGITALELAQGRPPRSRESPQQVLIKTIREAPPTLDREGGTNKYSQSFKEFVDSCLVKDPSKRPTAYELLHSSFFKKSTKKSYLVNAILKDLPPLAHRQERRIVRGPSFMEGTIDSWDFAMTLNSPHSARNTFLGRPVSMAGSEERKSLDYGPAPPVQSVPEEDGEQAISSSPSVSSPSQSDTESSCVASPPTRSPLLVPAVEDSPPEAALEMLQTVIAPITKSAPIAVPRRRPSETLDSSLSSSVSSSLNSSGPGSSFSSSSRSASGGIWKKFKSSIKSKDIVGGRSR